MEDRLAFLRKFEAIQGIGAPDDWYKVANRTLFGDKGTRQRRWFSEHWKSSLGAARELYPTHEFYEWKVANGVPDHFWDERANRLKFRDWLGAILAFETPEDWCRLSKKLLDDNHGKGILQHYGGVLAMVRDFFPEHSFIEWSMADGVPGRFWNLRANRERYFRWMSEQLGIEKPEDWYAVTYPQLKALPGGYGFSQLYGGALQRMLPVFVPDYDFKPWLFVKTPAGYFDMPEHRLKYLRWFEERLDLKSPEDWYRVVAKDFSANSAGAMLQKHYRGHPYNAALELHPEYDWLPWKFDQVPEGHWDDQRNRFQLMAWLEDELGIQSPDDWLKVAQSALVSRRASGILQYDRRFTIPFLAAEYTGALGQIEPWEYHHVSPNFWNSQSNQTRFLLWLEQKLGYQKPEDWYQITQRKVRALGGQALIARWNGSPFAIAALRHPGYPFKQWLFDGHVAPGFWEEGENRLEYLRWLETQLGYTRAEDWYRATEADFFRFHGATPFVTQWDGQTRAAAEELYPNFAFDPSKFVALTRQAEVYAFIKEFFPSARILYNYKHPKLRFAATKRPMEIDIYLPDQNIAIEYQGEQHFFPVGIFGGEEAFRATQRRDAEKRESFAKAGLAVVEVPYFWNGKPKTLRQILEDSVPDLRLAP